MESTCNPRTRASSTMLLLALVTVMAFHVQARQLQQGLPTNSDSEPLKMAVGTPLFNSAATPRPASAAAVAEPQQAVPDQMAPILNEHNRVRALHGAGPLTWNSDLANQAANWARGCNFQHSQPNGQYGENLYLTSAKGAGAAAGALMGAIKGWYDEVKDYDFNNPGFSMTTGHFTQVVWKGSTQLGCGVQDCPSVGGVSGFNGGTIVVCQYKPPGNYEGEFRQNVLPPQSGGGGNPPPTPPPSVPPPTPGGGGGTLPPFNPSSALVSGKGLQAGQCITSGNGKHRLCVLRSGIIQVQSKASSGSWSRSWSNGVAGPTSGAKPFMLGLFPDGNLVAMDSQNKKYWETKTSGSAPFVLIMRDTGNLVLYDSKPTCLWSTKGNCALRKRSQG